MIKIGKIEKTTNNGKTRLTSIIEIDGGKYPLWYEVDEKYGFALCDDRSDAFVAGLMKLAITKRQDIAFESPITWQLKDGLEHDFVDVICQKQSELHHTKFVGPICDAITKNREVLGTGVSCGVDSLFTIKRRFVDTGSDKKRYLLLNNMTDEDGNREYRFSVLCKNAKVFASETGIDLIISNSNFTSGEIPGLTSEGSTTFCTLFAVLSLQNLFTRYYIASGGPVNDFGLYINNGLFGTDCSNYDLLTLSACSTSSLKFIVDGLEDRFKKVAAIVDWPPAWNALDVCFLHANGNGNGTYDCPKCMHTVVEILVQGGMEKLEQFRSVFDVDYVKGHMHEYLADVMRIRLHGHEYGRELWPRRKVAGFKASDYPKAVLILAKKILKKTLRGGKTLNGGFSPRG